MIAKSLVVTKSLLFLGTVLIGLIGAPTALWGQTGGGFAYVANCGAGPFCPGGIGTGDVSAYSIDGATGKLTALTGSPFPAGTNPFSVTADPTGQFAFVANFGSNNVWVYVIDGTTGALAPVAGSPFLAGSVPLSVTTTAGPPPPAR